MTSATAPWTHSHRWTIPAPPARVFEALTEPAELRRWFAEHVDVGRAAGERYRFWGRHTLRGDEPARQTLTHFAPGEALGFAWPLGAAETAVHLALAPAGDDGASTSLALTHDVTGDLGGPRQRELIADHWHFMIGNLIAHLAGGDGVVRPDFADPAPEVRLTIDIDAPVDVVFRALMEPERVNRWLMSTAAEIDPRVGGRYAVNWRYKVDGRDVVGGPTTILELVPNKRLVLDWPDWRGDASVTGQTITFDLEPVDEGSTRLTFVHAGFTRTADVGDYPFGWRGFLEELVKEATRE